MDVADAGLGVQKHGDSRPALLHVAAVGHQNQPGLQRIDLDHGHVSDNGLQCKGTDNGLTDDIAGVKLGQIAFNDRPREERRVVLMILSGHAHADVVKQAGHEDGEDAVLVGADLVPFKAHGNSGVVEQVGELERVLDNLAHVDRAVVVVAETADAHDVGVILEGLDLRVVQHPVGDIAQGDRNQLQQAAIEADLLG